VKRFKQWIKETHKDIAEGVYYSLMQCHQDSGEQLAYFKHMGVTNRCQLLGATWMDLTWPFFSRHKRTATVYFWIAGTLHHFKWWLLSLLCKWRGHDWVDESYGGPDSGCMAGTCNRCGYSFHTTLY